VETNPREAVFGKEIGERVLMKVLITGGNGMLGRTLVRELGGEFEVISTDLPWDVKRAFKVSANYYIYDTQKGEITGLQIPIKTTSPIFYISSMMIAATEGKTIDGIKMEGNWVVNDGIVPLASALYPLTDADTAKSYEDSIEKDEKIETGRWYYMNTMFGTDHFDFCGTKDYPTTAEDFYVGMAELVNSR